MYRTHTCGELRLQNLNQDVTLCGWIQKNRDLGGMTFIDLRDRYGITQLAFNMDTNKDLCVKAQTLQREFVVRINGKVIERSSKNFKIPTGEIEVEVSSIEILNKSKIPPFTIEDNTDGGDELRMKFRYLDLRRNPVKKNMMLRHKMGMAIRNYLSDKGFLEIETPFLIRSTPEGARDFVVPSRMNEGEFYALPQSPQTFKQLLMVSGFDKYFQIVRCFRDEDLRADRQPEFTQIDCEMSFVTQEDILQTFEGLVRFLFKEIKNIDIENIPRISYDDAMKYYGSDKPDIRFGMKFTELNTLCKIGQFKVFDDAELVVGFCAQGASEYSRKQLDALTDFVKRPQIGAQGLIYVKYNNDGTIKSSVDKFFDEVKLKSWCDSLYASPGDLILIMAGAREKTQIQLSALRLEMAKQLNLINNTVFAPMWVLDFPLLEWDEEANRFFAKHHPFTSPKIEDIELLNNNPIAVRANAYDLVINGSEIGGGSIRIHNKELQQKMFSVLGFSPEEAKKQFGFLMEAFEYGAPPHGGIAFGFDRFCAVFGGSDSIRDYIAFPKNNSGRDVMIDAPAAISDIQLKELSINIVSKKKN